MPTGAALQELAFTTNEKALVCSERAESAYRHIPNNQKVFFLKRFMRARGYFSADINIDDGMIMIEPGMQTAIRVIAVDSNMLEPRKFWQVIGQPLTSKRLDEIKTWGQQELYQAGHPCAEVNVTADPESGVVQVHAVPRAERRFPLVRTEQIGHLQAGVEARLYAFEQGDPYNSMLLDLSALRLEREGLVLSAAFLTHCTADQAGLTVEQSVTPGEPRMVSFALGIDTEELLLIDGTWRSSRLGKLGSSISVNGRISYIRQLAEVESRYYYLPLAINHYVRSRVRYLAKSYDAFHDQSMHVSTGPAWQYDAWGVSQTLWLGAQFEHIETSEGVGPSTSNASSLGANLMWESHDHEFYRSKPRSGFSLALDIQAARRDFGSDYSANKVLIDGTALANLFGMQPPIWILGLRFRGEVLEPVAGSTDSEIPVGKRIYLGGNESLRGFFPFSLPKEGALTGAYVGSEARLANVFPYGLQPIAFFDFGRFSDQPWQLEATNYLSPGIGVNWQSIIGTIRMTFARAIITGEDRESRKHLERWKAYFSYGEQF